MQKQPSLTWQQLECNGGNAMVGIVLSAYQFDIEYKGSKQHANADGLSRLPIQGSTALEYPVSVFQLSFVDELPMTASEIADETSRDETLATVY